MESGTALLSIMFQVNMQIAGYDGVLATSIGNYGD